MLALGPNTELQDSKAKKHMGSQGKRHLPHGDADSRCLAPDPFTPALVGITITLYWCLAPFRVSLITMMLPSLFTRLFLQVDSQSLEDGGLLAHLP